MFETVNVFDAIKTAPKDQAVGIAIAKLTGADSFGLYCSEFPPGISAAPHYHSAGIETYQILEGEATMRTGAVNSGNRVIWDKTEHVKTGDFFTIPENTVHQLSNTSDKKLIVIFGAPASHLGKDRIIIKE